MRDSGSEEIVKLIIYPVEATVQHILKGSNYYHYKALRVRFLIGKVLADVLNRQLSKRAESIRKQGRTPALWVQCLEMAANFFIYIRAERTSNIDLHFKSRRNMLPYFIAAGHHQYAKRRRISMQLFDAWSNQCADLMDEVSGKGHHTVRCSSRNLRGTRSDMSIEESVMREAKTSGGIDHGALRHEDALDLGLSLWATPVKLVKIMLGHFVDKLTLLVTSFRIQLSPPRPEVLWQLKLLLTFLRRIILLIQA